jgi:N-acetyl-anhydromuramoyl-L-alanine amidase
MKLAADGWLEGARRVPSPNRDARPDGAAVSLLLLHAISLPPGEYGGDAIERLFTNTLDPGAHPYFAEIAGLEVSSHFLVRRDGALLQFVPAHERAWHAGASTWRGRGRCNDFSLGVELEGSEEQDFAHVQYVTLAALARCLRAALPLRDVAAHSEVAPGRKTDPGPRFDWSRLLADLASTPQAR